MRAELRPSSLGEILDRTAQMYRSHFLLYFGIAAVSYAAVLVLSLLANLLLFSHHVTNVRQFGRLSLLVSSGIGILAILPIAIAMAAVMRAVAMNYLGQSTTIGGAYASIRQHWYRYILIMMAMYTYAIVPAVMVMGVTFAIVAAVPVSFGRNLLVGLMVVLVFAAFGAAFWWLLRWLLAVPASLMEGLTVHRSLKRSALLTQGARGRIFVMLLLVVAVMMVIQYAIQIPMFILLWKSRGVPTLATQIVASFGTFFSGSFVLPIYSIALTLFYYDQRIRKEGYDVEWLMEQAAMSPDTNSPGSISSGSISSGATVPGTLTPQTDPPGPAV
jgi:Membrane domain of glycerophosphoryl diester phosphodiesterase